jgi:hypothetical protein
MTWPTDDLTNTHLDAATDDPSQARAELNSLLLKVQAILQEVDAGATVWHSGNDGTGTGLDADKLDGQQGPTGSIVGTTDSQTLTNKTLTSPTINTSASGSGIETTLAGSATKLATASAIKTYVDNNTGGWAFQEEVDTSSGTTKIVTGISSDVTQIKLIMDGVGMATDNIDVRVRLGTSGSFSTFSNGSTNRLNNSGNSEIQSWGSGYGYATSDLSNSVVAYGEMLLVKKSGETAWIGSVSAGSSGNQTYHGGGVIACPGTINRVEISPEGAGSFSGGTIQVFVYT